MAVDWARVETLLRALASGEEAATWQALQLVLYDELLRLARLQPIGRLRGDVDAAAEVAARVLARLHANGFRAVKRLCESAQPEVRAWIRVVVRTAAIDVMREHADYVRGTEHREAGWVSLQTLTTSPGAAPPNSLVEKQRELERYLEGAVADAARAADTGTDAILALAIRWRVEPLHVRRLVKKGATYLPVLRLVLAGLSYPEVARELATTRREVELVVGYVEELLRARRFGT